MRHPLDAYPRYALVLWPDALDKTLPSCVVLASLDDAVKRGAKVVICEWEPIPAQVTDEGDAA